MSDEEQCVECGVSAEKRPLEGIDEDGLCLPCANKRQEERKRERQRRIDERYREALSDDDTGQASLSEVMG